MNECINILINVCVSAGDENNRQVVMRILYHISIDDRSKDMFVYTDCIPQVHRQEYELLTLTFILTLIFLQG